MTLRKLIDWVSAVRPQCTVEIRVKRRYQRLAAAMVVRPMESSRSLQYSRWPFLIVDVVFVVDFASIVGMVFVLDFASLVGPSSVVVLVLVSVVDLASVIELASLGSLLVRRWPYLWLSACLRRRSLLIHRRLYLCRRIGPVLGRRHVSIVGLSSSIVGPVFVVGL
ncbi:hypothetical protein RND81_02G144600 [Saponaria officinalis]|uniref:Uncharacterized protein n=1 Tax=Saponaria officinalis TaxID=3572 RepID=A0AAW1MM35_SAPOF